MNRRNVSIALGALMVLLLVIQLVPYRVQANPPVVEEPAWDSPETRALAKRACFDCHSNESVNPWYGNIAPFSWMVRHHIDDARHEVNLSEMHLEQEEAHEAGEKVEEGVMPPKYYTLLHPDARLTEAEKQTLITGLNATLGSEGGHGEHAEHEEHDD